MHNRRFGNKFNVLLAPILMLFIFVFIRNVWKNLKNVQRFTYKFSKLTYSNTCTTNALKIVWTESMTIFLKSSLILVPALKWVYHRDRTISTVTIVCLLKLHCTVWSIIKHYIPKFRGKTRKIHCLMEWNGYRAI